MNKNHLICAVALAAFSASTAFAAENLYVSSKEVGNRGFFTKTAGFAPKGAEEAGWTKLYNGKDLTGWFVKDGKKEAWKANGEMISCVQDGGGWLASEKQYGDFELRIDYRIPKGGNSGIGIRFPTVGDPAHVGMEIQCLDDAAPEYKNLDPAQYNGGIYYQSAAKVKAAKAPGEWNRYEIRCKGNLIHIKLNGVEIQDVDVSTFTKGRGGHKSLAERPRVGHIGMQSHGHQVDFRNIELRELK